MANATYHKLLSGSHTRWESDKGDKGDWTVYEKGDLIPNLREEEIESLGADRLEEQGSLVTSQESTEAHKDDTDALLSKSIPEIEAALAGIDSKEELEAIRARELSSKGQGRAGAIKAINKRIEALS